ncbi:MAG: ABC transporter permease, partial [Streptococcaceae bacterium]|nr:ABC transporter permease [Streptococcaceae bacterium]
MNFIKRAWLFTKAKISRTILLIVAFTAILLFVVSGLVINSAANKSIENAQKSTGATVTLSVDRQKQFDAMRKQMQSQGANAGFQPAKIQQTPVELSQAEKIASLSDVKSYLFQTSASVTKSTGITPITSTDNNSDNQGFGGRVAMMGGQDLASADFRLTGVNATAVYTDFTDGTSTMVSGRGITDEDKGTNNVVIEQSLATSNNLTVGSSFKIKDGNSKEQTMKVVGIYKTTASATGMDAQINAMNPSNNIFVYYATATSLSASGKAGTIDSAVYNLNDPGQMSQFVKTASADVDTNTFALTTNDALYQQMLQPLHNVASFAKNIIILVSIAGAVILA